MWTAVLPVYDRLNLSFRLITSPKERTFLYRLFKSNLSKSYEVTWYKISTSWCQSRDHFKNVDCSTSSLIFNIFNFSTNIRPNKRNSFILKVQIQFEQKLWRHSFQMLTFWYQSRFHFKNVDCSASSLIFAQFHL